MPQLLTKTLKINAVFKARDLLKSRNMRNFVRAYPPRHRKTYDVTVLVQVTAAQDLFPLTRFKGPNKSLLF